MTVKFNKTLFFIDVLLPLMDKHSLSEIKKMPHIFQQIETLYTGNIENGFKNWRRRDLEEWRKNKELYKFQKLYGKNAAKWNIAKHKGSSSLDP